MKTHPLTTLACTALLSALPATSQQQPDVEIRGFNAEFEETTSWGDVVEEPIYGELRFRSLEGELAIVMLHVALAVGDNPDTTKGALEIYPFLEPSDASWQIPAIGTHYELVGEVPSQFSIPSTRAVALLEAASEASIDPEGLAGYGVVDDSSMLPQTFVEPAGWHRGPPNEIGTLDERRPWTVANAWASTASSPETTFHIATVAKASVSVAAHFASAPHQLDDLAIANLYEFLDKEVGFSVCAQVFYLKPKTIASGRAKIRVARPVFFTKRSLKELTGDPYLADHGPIRTLPDVTNSANYFFVAHQHGEMHAMFDYPVAGMSAWVQAPEGLRQVLQLPDAAPLSTPVYEATDPNAPATVSTSYVARFPFPIDGLSGIAYFEFGGVLVQPRFGQQGGALVWALAPLHD